MSLQSNLENVQRRIAVACDSAGRDPSGVRLIAVTKTVPVEIMKQMAELGVRDFGENRVQEARSKIPEFSGVRWHLIGRLQSNKSNIAARLFDAIHTFEDADVARRVGNARDENADPVAALMEVDFSDIPGRAGVKPGDAEEMARSLMGVPGIHLTGLMTVAPPGDDAVARDCFLRLRGLRDRIEDATSWSLPELSMGMSNDFDVAIAQGATMIRVGRALFGERPAP